MKPKFLLRIASAFMLLHTVGHTIGALTWKQAPNAAIAQIVSGMLNNHFEFGGRQVSLGQFFDGYGVGMIFVLLFVTVLLWLLSSAPAKPLIILTGLFLMCFGVSEVVYFFPLAAGMSLLAGVCTLLALRNNG